MTITRVQGGSISVGTGNTGTATATCPAGALLVGGGGTAQGTDFDPAFNANAVGSWPSTPGPGGTWSYRATSAPFLEGGGAFTLTAYAVCAA